MNERLGNFFYAFDQIWAGAIPRLFARIYTSGAEHVPLTGPALLLANHISHFDPPVMSLAIPRVIHYMADKPLLEFPIAGPLLALGHAFPIDRKKEIDLSAIKTAITRLKAGHLVGIYPEGGIRFAKTSVLGGAELPIGTAALWQKTKVPVIPMVILGTDQLYAPQKWLTFPRVIMKIGPCLWPDPLDTKEALRDKIVSSWQELYQAINQEHKLLPHELPHSAQERWAGF